MIEPDELRAQLLWEKWVIWKLFKAFVSIERLKDTTPKPQQNLECYQTSLQRSCCLKDM